MSLPATCNRLPTKLPKGTALLAERKGAPLSEERVLSTFVQIALALLYLHRKKILHRDLKPGNVMLRTDGSVALIDFGLAKEIAQEDAITGRGEIFGTPFYMSPEQGHGRAVDVRSDLYSLGIIFYEMLTGKKPFQATTPMGVASAERPPERSWTIPPMPMFSRPRRFASPGAAFEVFSTHWP